MQITRNGSRLTIEGDIDAGNVAQVIEALQQVPLVLDVSEADVTDGPAMAALTAALKRLLLAGHALALVGSPQLLVHNLYRVGYYPHAGLDVQGLRQDEAYG